MLGRTSQKKSAATGTALEGSHDISGVQGVCAVCSADTLPTCMETTQHEEYKQKPSLIMSCNDTVCGVPAARNGGSEERLQLLILLTHEG